ncbi:hypothetical protein FJY93_01825 [Candidatus Kaiserbacteria bacterium]|nr:hypothetical protein [Candidatus Kaiserbacteria bacterium]
MKKKVTHKKGKVDSIEKLAILMVEGFADIDKRFDVLETEVRGIRNDLIVQNKQLDRIETRIAALEFAVFGVKNGHASTNWFERIEKLEKAVFKK